MANAMDVQAVLTANTAGFDGPMQKSAAVGEATARAVARANAEAAKATALASKFAGDTVSEQSVRIVKAREAERAASMDFRKMQALARQGYIDESTGATAAAAALQRLQAAKIATAAASETEAAATEHAAITQQMAASAAVRSLEGNAGIRSVERFLTTIPGVGVALQGIFPLIGAGAFIGMLVRGGTELYDFEQKAKHAGATATEAFDEVNAKLDVQNDDLRIQSDRLADEAAKLAKHPGNGLQTALDEMKKSADELLISLKADRKELDADLAKVGGLGSLVSGVAPTGRQVEEILGDQAELTKSIRKANEDFSAAVAGDNTEKTVKAAGDRRTAAILQAYDAQIKAYSGEKGRLAQEERQSREDSAAARAAGNDFGGMTINNSAKMDNISSRLDELRRMRDNVALAAKVGEQEQQVAAAKGAANAATDGNKAAEARLKAFKAQVNEMQLQFGLSNKAEFDFWEVKKAIFAAGSAQFREIEDRQVELAKEGRAKAAEGIKKIMEDAKRLASLEPPKILNGNDPFKASRQQDARALEDRRDTANELAAIQTRTAEQLAEMAIADQVGRTIDRESAAMELASVHTRAYGDELARLQAKRDAIANNPLLTNNAEDQQKQVDALNRQIAQLQAGRQIQVAQDQYTIKAADQSALTGAKEALVEFAQATTNAGEAMKNVLSGGLNATNGGLIKMLTEPHWKTRGQWGGVGHDIFTEAAGAGLKGLEGKALKSLGIGGGKRDGSSAASALWVQSATLPGGGGAGALASLAGPSASVLPLLDGFKSEANVTGDGASSMFGGLGKFASTALSLLPAFASGVDDFAGGPALVGEKGPEIVDLPAGSSVVPNNQIGNMGGDTHHHYSYSIDARGATDPAQTAVMVQRAIQQAAPHIVAASMAAQTSRNRRTPTMNKR